MPHPGNRRRRDERTKFFSGPLSGRAAGGTHPARSDLKAKVKPEKNDLVFKLRRIAKPRK
jgi:hypothetical protein